MSASKESELITAVVLYATRCAVEGVHQALRAMNFGPEEVDALADVALGDIQRMASLRAHCLRIELNRGLFWPMIEHLQRQRVGGFDSLRIGFVEEVEGALAGTDWHRCQSSRLGRDAEVGA